MSVTFRYTIINGGGTKETVTVKGPEYGSDEAISRRQTIGETMGDMIYVYTLSKDKRELHLSFVDLTAEERGLLERFFSPLFTDFAKRWFEIELPPFKQIMIRAGGSVGGSTVRAATGSYKAGQYVLHDKITYKVRLIEASLNWSDPREVQGGNGGLFNVAMTLRVLSGFLPTNV